VPVPKSRPPSSAHRAASSTTHAKAPAGEPAMQHWIGATVVEVVLVVLATVEVVASAVVEVDVELVLDVVPKVIEVVVVPLSGQSACTVGSFARNVFASLRRSWLSTPNAT
jgi:hypothetical protein